MRDDFNIEYADLKNENLFAEIHAFQARFKLTFDHDVEFTVIVRDRDGRMVGTGSFAGEILRNIAVDESIQGAGLTSLILSELMQEMARRGIMHYFIFTMPSKAHLFASLGFNEIARAEPYAVLLESGLGSVKSYCESIAREIAHLPGERAAVVVNCNPCTKGHLALIKKAADENKGVIVFVVSEDRSLFPFADRIRLVRAGIAGLENVAVVAAGKYMVSSATFPTYFTRKDEQVVAQTRLDASLFASQIAPRLDISARYIGEEPYCPVTGAYNRAMLDIFPGRGIKIHVMPRISVEGNIVVSASKVREMIRQGDWERVRLLLPDTTLDYLQADENRHVIERICASDSRH